MAEAGCDFIAPLTDKEQIKANLEALFIHLESDQQLALDNASIDQYSRQFQAKKLAKLLDTVIKKEKV